MKGNNNNNSSIKALYDKIPEHCYEAGAFLVLMLIIGSHIVNMISKALWVKDLYLQLFGVCGGIAIVFVVFYLGSLCYKKEKKEVFGFKKIKIWDMALLLMLIWSTISALLADEKEISIYGTPGGNEGLVTYLMYAAYFVCAKILKSDKKRKYIFWGIGIMISVMSMASIPQAVTGFAYGFTMYASTLRNINHFAYLLTMGALIFAGAFLEEKRIIVKVLALILCGFNMWSMIVNTTMGGYVAVWFGVVFLIVISLVHNKEKWKAAIVLFIVLLGVNIGMNLGNGMISENIHISMYGISEEGLSDDAGSGRIGLWRHAFGCIKERPVFGYGPEGFYRMFMNEEVGSDRPHNEYIQHAAFLGIPGLVFYLTALISLFIYCIKRLKQQEYFVLSVGATVFAYCVSAFFGNTLYYAVVYYFILLGLLSGCCREQK